MPTDPLDLLLTPPPPKRASQTVPPIDTSTIPIALVLWVTHLQCECGSSYTVPAEHILVRYKGDNGFGHRYTRLSAAPVAHLPRETMVRRVTCPYCPNCFHGVTVDRLAASPKSADPRPEGATQLFPVP